MFDSNKEINPESIQGKILNFLAVNNEEKYTPVEVSAELDISETSSTRAMRSLEREGFVELSGKSYYIPKEKISDVRSFILTSWVKEGVEALPSGDDVVWCEPSFEASRKAEEIVKDLLENSF